MRFVILSALSNSLSELGISNVYIDGMMMNTCSYMYVRAYKIVTYMHMYI
jgi:hypothetical protein